MGGGTVPVFAESQYPRLAPAPVGQQIESIYRDRLNQFTSGGQYEGQNLLS
jgi:alpha-mannosidase